MAAAWFALRVRIRQERSASSELQRRGFPVFLPEVDVRRAWSDRIKIQRRPLFPGYLFVRCAGTASDRLTLLGVPAVQGLVGATNGPTMTPIPTLEIESLRQLIASRRSLDPMDALVVGKRVRVVRGPLRGIAGIITDAESGRGRLVVHIDLLSRGVRCELAPDDVLEDDETSAVA